MVIRSRHLVKSPANTDEQSCAATLANHPSKFKVTLLERSHVVGGQATSIPLEEQRYGASWMNNGVQGGSQVSPARNQRPCRC